MYIRQPDRTDAQIRADVKKRNEQRVAKLRGALMGHYGARIQGAKTALVDMLSDVRHLCDKEGIDLGEVDKISHRHYLSEKEGEL